MPLRRVRPRVVVPLHQLTLFTACLGLGGCSSQLRDGRLAVVWLAASLLVSLVGSFLWADGYRRRQLKTWDLRQQPTSPEANTAIAPLAWVLGAVFIGFLLLNLLSSDISLFQRLVNSGLWLLGSLLGAGFGFYFGIQVAERRAATGEKHG